MYIAIPAQAIDCEKFYMKNNILNYCNGNKYECIIITWYTNSVKNVWINNL